MNERGATFGAKALLLICVTSAAWAFSFGVGSQVVSHWLSRLRQNDAVIGWAHSFYYFGLAVAAFAVPRLARQIGYFRCGAIGMIGSGVTLAVFPWCEGELAWYLLRFLNGCAGALSLVPLETIVSRESPADKKTLNFGCYGVAITIGGALGIALGLEFFEHVSPVGSFYLGSGPTVWAGLILVIARDIHAETEAITKTPLGWTRNYLSYATAWYQGFLEGGMIAFLSLFLVSRGFSRDGAGILMSITTVGVIAFQLPVSMLADRFGKRPLLLGCYGVVALGLATIPWLSTAVWFGTVLFVFGACTGAMYPLGLSLLGDRTVESGLARAYAWYLAVECFGSQAGAAAMGGARKVWGEDAMFAVGLGAAGAVLVIGVSLRLLLRDQRDSITSLDGDQRQAA